MRMKIKNKVDLDILKSMDFKEQEDCWFKKVYMKNDNDDRVCYRISKLDRIIHITRLDGEIDDTLFRLFKLNLVESE